MNFSRQLMVATAILAAAACDSKSPSANTTLNPEQSMDTRWKCSHCNEWHTDLPFAYGPDFPDLYYDIPKDERDERVVASKDFCIIDGAHHFVRGRLEIPIVDSDKVFAWVVWVSQSEANFKRTLDLIETEGRESEPPYFGWLSTRLRLYPDTTNLKTQVHTSPVGLVPTIELEPTDHPLAAEQRNGITLARVREIAGLLLHPGPTPLPSADSAGSPESRQ